MQDQSLINGLLAKRTELQRESVDARERMACIANDLAALDRVLEACGYRGELTGKTPLQTRIHLFQRNELRTYIKDELAKAGTPLTTRELASRICAVEGKDAQDRRLLASVTNRVAETLRKMKAGRVVESEATAGRGNRHAWRLALI